MRFLFSLKTLSAVVLFLLPSSSLPGGTNGWRNVSPPGGDIHSILFDTKDPDLVFAAALGIYRSTDAGRNWEELRSPTTPRYVRRLIGSPAQSGVVYALKWEPGISVSTDKGETWSFLAFPDSQVTSLAVDPSDGSRLYGVVQGALHKSTNHGVIWAYVDQGLGSARAVAVSPADGTVFLASNQGTHRSTDHGASWTKASDQAFDDFVFHPQKPEVIFGLIGTSVFKSTDRGQTWAPKIESSSGLPSFALSPDSPHEIYVGATNFKGVLRSTDDGETWTQWNTGLANLDVRALAVRTGNPNVVLIGTRGAGVLRREEQAAAWNSSTNGIRRPNVTGIASDLPGNRVFISTFGAGIFRSPLSEGFQWTTLNEGLPNLLLRDLTIDPHNPSILYVAVLGEGLYRTTDAGQHWVEAKNGLGTNAVGFLVADPQIPGRLIMTGGAPPNVNLLFESTNYGASWTQFAAPLPGYTFTPPVIDSESGRIYLITLDGLYRTQNSEGSWEKLSSEKLWRLVVEPGVPDRLFATTENMEIARSTDGGQNWKTVGPSGASFIQLTYLPGNPPQLLALGPAGIFSSINSGETWIRLTGSPSADFFFHGAISDFVALPSDPARLLAGFEAPGGLYTLEKTDSLFFPLLTAVDGRTTGLALTNHRNETLQLSMTAFKAIREETPASDTSVTASLNILPEGQKAGLTQELFGFKPIGGWIRADQTKNVATGLASVFSPDLSALDALPAEVGTFNRLVFPEVDASARIRLGNPNATSADVFLHLVTRGGIAKGEPVRTTISPAGLLTAAMVDLFPEIQGTDYIYVSSDLPLFGAEEIGQAGRYLAALSAQDATGASFRVNLPHFAAGPDVVTTITLVNVDTVPGLVSLRVLGNDSAAIGWGVRLPAAGKVIVQASDLAGLNIGETISGYLRIESEDVRFIGSVRFTDPAAVKFGTTLPVHGIPSRAWVLPHLVSTADYFTSMAVLNPGTDAAQLTVQVIRADGSVLAEEQQILQPGERLCKILTELFPSLAGQELNSGSIRILSDREVNCMGLFGAYALTALSAIPANVIP